MVKTAMVLALLTVPSASWARCIECSQATQFAYLGAVTQSNAMSKAYGWDRSTKSRGTSSGPSVGMAATTRAALAEELKLLFVTLHAGWQGARRGGVLQQYADGTAQLFKTQGTDLRGLRLTEAGFVAR